MNSVEYEIHFAADNGDYEKSLANKIYEFGFIDDPLVRKGVVFFDNNDALHSSCPLIGLHVTWDTTDLKEFKLKLANLDDFLKSENGSYSGYAHAEIIKSNWDTRLKWKQFENNCDFPASQFEPIVHEGLSKRWDIHISAKLSTLDERLHSILFEQARMYYIDLQKDDGIYRIFTIQGVNHSRQGRFLYEKLKFYLLSVGGMEGAIKYEHACYWIQSGDSRIIPPTIDTIFYKEPSS